VVEPSSTSPSPSYWAEETRPFYILSGRDHPAFNADLCNWLPFSWQTLSPDERVSFLSCNESFPAANSHGLFQGCTEESRTRAFRGAPKNYRDLPWFQKERQVGCVPCSMKTNIDFHVEQAVRHPRRVHDPDKAEVFLVPYSFERSRFREGCLDSSSPTQIKAGYLKMEHRSESLLKALQGFGPWRRLGPKAFHFHEPNPWRLGGNSARSGHRMYMSTLFYKEVYTKATWGLENAGTLSYDRGTAGCIVVSPLVPKPNLWVPDESFGTWNKRSIGLFFRYFARRTAAGEHLRPPLLKGAKPKMWFKHSIVLKKKHPPGAFVQEIKDSKFCLHLKTDNPWSHRFYDAIVAGCIVVIISDGAYPTYTPYTRHFNYKDFVVFIKEKEFVRDPALLVRTVGDLLKDTATMQRMYESLLKARRALLLIHPQSTSWQHQLMDIHHNCLEKRS